jgi:succinyl-CoA synthetase beta subunit
VKLHKYQAREIFRAAGIPVPPGRLASTPDEAAEAARAFGARVVVKAQVHSGGRGKAGGVKLAGGPEEAAERARAILGLTIGGYRVDRVLVTPAAEIAAEFYAGIVLDRTAHSATVLVSGAGGVDIERVAEETPERLVRLPVDRRYGLLEHQALRLGFALVPDLAGARAVARVLSALWRVFLERDASLAEVNPLARTPRGEILALDAKLVVDDNALFRQPEIEALRDPAAEEPAEAAARAAGLSYVRLDGDVGCVVNGAGLAMATMDLIRHHGGAPANFLDIGGSSSPEKVVAAMRILLADERVRSVLVNIFGGITRCDDVARGLVAGLRERGGDVPVSIRLTGTNEAEAVRILREASLAATTSMDEAVRRAVELARERARTAAAAGAPGGGA